MWKGSQTNFVLNTVGAHPIILLNPALSYTCSFTFVRKFQPVIFKIDLQAKHKTLILSHSPKQPNQILNCLLEMSLSKDIILVTKGKRITKIFVVFDEKRFTKVSIFFNVSI